MAKKSDNPPVPQQKVPGQQGNASKVMLFSLLIVAVMIIALPTVIVIFFGMLPSLVAYIIDRSDEKYSTFCVIGMNFAGVFPYLMELWAGENTIDAAMAITTDVFALLVMYSASGFGWMIFVSVPPVIVAFLTVMAQRRMVSLRDEQKTLIEEWGNAVITVDEEAENAAATAKNTRKKR